MGFVNNENLVAIPARGKSRAFDQVTGIIHPAVAGRVHFYHVQRTGAIPRQFPARGTFPARRIRGRLRTIQAAGKDARRGSFPAPARAGEEIGVHRALPAQRSHEGTSYLLLADNILKTLRAIPPIQCHAHEYQSTGYLRHESRAQKTCGYKMVDTRRPTHPPEPAYPCCLPALGEFCKMTPRGESGASLNEFAGNAKHGEKHGEIPRLHFHHFLCRRPAVHSLA